jgi:hypothetical protein
MSSFPPTIRRADIWSYIFVLLGIQIIIDYGLTSSGVALQIGGIVVGLSAIGGSVLNYLNPDNINNGSDPAPSYLFVLAGIATVAFAIVIISIYLSTHP